MTSRERADAILWGELPLPRETRALIAAAIDAAVAEATEWAARQADEWRYPDSITEFYKGVDATANEIGIRIRARGTPAAAGREGGG